MKIAVLMSTYNGHKFLNDQLKSLARQTLADFVTLYIRDDGSTDDTLDIIDSWKKDIDIVVYEGENSGPAKSFWELLMNDDIQAEYYAFCDQDDIWDVDKLERGIERLNDNIHLYACNCRIIDENAEVLREIRVLDNPNMSVQRLFVSGYTQGCSMIFTNKICQYLRRLDIKCVPMHDIILTLYANYLGETYWDMEPHFGYRVHSNNVVAKSNKSGLKKIRTVYWNWKNSCENSMAKVAVEMLDNIPNIPKEEKFFLERIAEYKKNRLWIIRYVQRCVEKSSSLKSFMIRVLLGIY